MGIFKKQAIKATRKKILEVYNDTDHEWRWRLINSNGRVSADSGEGYTRKDDAIRAAKRLKEIAAAAEIKVIINDL